MEEEESSAALSLFLLKKKGTSSGREGKARRPLIPFSPLFRRREGGSLPLLLRNIGNTGLSFVAEGRGPRLPPPNHTLKGSEGLSLYLALFPGLEGYVKKGITQKRENHPLSPQQGEGKRRRDPGSSSPSVRIGSFQIKEDGTEEARVLSPSPFLRSQGEGGKRGKGGGRWTSSRSGRMKLESSPRKRRGGGSRRAAEDPRLLLSSS